MAFQEVAGGGVHLDESAPLLLSVRDASGKAGLSESQVRKLIRDGRLAHVKVGLRLFVPRGAIEDFIGRNTVRTCPEEIPDRDCGSSTNGTVFTSAGLNQAAAVSALRALQIASRLKSSSPISSERALETQARASRPKRS